MSTRPARTISSIRWLTLVRLRTGLLEVAAAEGEFLAHAALLLP
ncbi:hypothetical protein ACIA8F_38770 [Streptomyces sp. NPDC051563]